MHRATKLTFLVAAMLSSLAAADTLTVKQLQADVKRYDGKEITATGKVEKFAQKVSKAGNDYFVFTLVDKTDRKCLVSIFGRGKVSNAPKDGDTVEVKGTYKIEKKLGNVTYKNELETKPNLVKVLLAN